MSKQSDGYEIAPATKLPTGLDAMSHFLAGVRARGGRLLREMWEVAHAAEQLEDEFRKMGERELARVLEECAQSCRRCEQSDSEGWFPRALAGLRETADRVCGLRPFPVQLVGVVALHRGCLAEMATGEGKTLVAAIAAILAGWQRRPCHVITVNDYLAERDAGWFRALFTAAGVSVGVVTGAMNVEERQAGYAADVTYTTSKEILADYLRDRIALGPVSQGERLRLRAAASGPRRTAMPVVMRGLHTAIVDEADSVLIDEAVTPLIISRERPNNELRDACREAQRLGEMLERGRDYQPDARFRDIELTAHGRERLAEVAASLPALWRGEARRNELVQQALVAREFHRREKEYLVHEGKVVIVDEFTGRMMPQRTWRDGLHQAIEAREGLEISSPTETLARMSFQRFFRTIPRLSGMTGTAWEARGEFWKIYRLPVVRIPTHRPVQRRLMADRTFRMTAEKWKAVVDEIVRVHATGRPVLIGTKSVAASEHLAEMLAAIHLPHRVLNASRHREEAMIVAEAGEQGAVSIATNMAGRGTDIKISSRVAVLGGLAVIATERHESSRIDRQLFGRSGRQGDPGTAQAFVSWEDEILARFLPAWVHFSLSKLRGNAGEIALRKAVTLAQRNAQRQAFQQRRSVLQSDQWIEESLGFAGRSLE
ncbi:MAG: hypothetical protein ABIP20_05615 [Chthoniobacteraceae bacterium]